MKGKISDDHERNPSESSLVDLESTVFNFRVLLPEIISGKLPSDEKGSPVDWVTNFFFFLFIPWARQVTHACVVVYKLKSRRALYACMHLHTNKHSTSYPMCIQ